MNTITLAEALAREGAFFASLLGILLLGAIFVLVLRTRSLPVCWNCGYRSIRRSESRRLLDGCARICLLHPYRCEKCLSRFYCFETRRVRRHSHNKSMTARST